MGIPNSIWFPPQKQIAQRVTWYLMRMFWGVKSGLNTSLKGTWTLWDFGLPFPRCVDSEPRLARLARRRLDEWLEWFRLVQVEFSELEAFGKSQAPIDSESRAGNGELGRVPAQRVLWYLLRRCLDPFLPLKAILMRYLDPLQKKVDPRFSWVSKPKMCLAADRLSV